MSRYGLRTSVPYEQYREFMNSTPAPQRDTDFFIGIPWVKQYLTAKNSANPYKTAPEYSRYGKDDSTDVYISRTIASDDTIPHMLLLIRERGWGNLEPDLPKDNKQRPFTAPSAPDSLLFVELKEGINGFANTAHGGAMCALLDETLGLTVELHRQTISATERGTMFTAGLNVSYLAPVPTPGVVMIRAWLLRREGRKWFLRAQVVNGEGKVLMEADSIWISAKPKASL